MTTLTGGGLFTFLTSLPSIAALVGDRVYPRRLPQTADFPVIVYRRISTAGDLAHTGPSGILTPRIQLDVWAEDPDTADAVAEVLRRELDGYRGQMGDVPVGMVRIVNDVDDDQPNTGLFRRVLDAEIQHEAVAA